MKDITPFQYELIVDAFASGDIHCLSPADIEKDILLTELLRHLVKFEDATFNITFGEEQVLVEDFLS